MTFVGELVTKSVLLGKALRGTSNTVKADILAAPTTKAINI